MDRLFKFGLALLPTLQIQQIETAADLDNMFDELIINKPVNKSDEVLEWNHEM